jgi:coniferyl-aldehyde dehydrogenase
MDTTTPHPEHANLMALLEAQRKAFAQDPMPSLQTRRDRLDRLLRLARQNASEIASSISQDFGNRAWQETFIAELATFEMRLRHTRSRLARWMRVRRVPTSLEYGLARNWQLPQPLGVVGVLSPWNYPFDLCMSPAIDALGAGNRVIIKPSELTPAFSALLARLVREHFDPTEMTVVEGDAQLAAAFSALPFDHLIFTGSTAVGRRVAAAAAPQLTPLTLELGGKSPVILDAEADLQQAADRIAWGKLFNAGQTCIAPDYVLAPRERLDEFVHRLSASMTKLYPSLAHNPDYTSIISARHLQRLHALLDDAAQQGATLHSVNPALETFDPAERKMAPCLVTEVNAGMRLMQEEIFGPVLPVMAYDTLDEALAHVNAHDRPLALYWFGRDRGRQQRVLRETISGGVSLNDCLLHVGQVHQHFGGIGPSGQGAHHGERGFNTFSHFKPVFAQSRLNGMSLVNPPYGRLLQSAWRWFSGKPRT